MSRYMCSHTGDQWSDAPCSECRRLFTAEHGDVESVTYPADPDWGERVRPYQRTEKPVFDESGELVALEITEVMTVEEAERRYPVKILRSVSDLFNEALANGDVKVRIQE